jgi:hypothetical protein
MEMKREGVKMYRIIVKVDGQSNIPLHVFEMPEMVDELSEFINNAKKNPDKFRLEIVGNFLWNEKVTRRFIDFFEPVKRITEMTGGGSTFEDASIFMGFLQAMAMIESGDGANEQLSNEWGNDIYG